MNEYEVEIELSGTAYVTVEAEDEDAAEEEARYKWHSGDVDWEVEHVRVECVKSGFSGDPDLDDEVFAIAKTTIRQFVRLIEYGITSSQLSYEHHDITMKDVTEAIGTLLAEDYGHALVPSYMKVRLTPTFATIGPWGLSGSLKEAAVAE